MKSSLMDVPAAIKLSKAALRNIHENLFWAFIYNVIGIPLDHRFVYTIWNYIKSHVWGSGNEFK